jgi:hypothetical protein
MLRMAKTNEASLRDDPKAMDRVNWQRVRLVVDHEAAHRDWGCALYRLHRTGRIDNEQREAGDRYATLVRDHRKLWHDPMLRFWVDDRHANEAEVKKLVAFGLGHVAADAIEPESEFEVKRAKRLSNRYNEAASIAGPSRNILEELLVDDIWPVGERGQKEIGHALTRLSHFFNTGTKRKR